MAGGEDVPCDADDVFDADDVDADSAGGEDDVVDAVDREDDAAGREDDDFDEGDVDADRTADAAFDAGDEVTFDVEETDDDLDVSDAEVAAGLTEAFTAVGAGAADGDVDARDADAGFGVRYEEAEDATEPGFGVAPPRARSVGTPGALGISNASSPQSASIASVAGGMEAMLLRGRTLSWAALEEGGLLDAAGRTLLDVVPFNADGRTLDDDETAGRTLDELVLFVVVGRTLDELVPFDVAGRTLDEETAGRLLDEAGLFDADGRTLDDDETAGRTLCEAEPFDAAGRLLDEAGLTRSVGTLDALGISNASSPHSASIASVVGGIEDTFIEGRFEPVVIGPS